MSEASHVRPKNRKEDHKDRRLATPDRQTPVRPHHSRARRLHRWARWRQHRFHSSLCRSCRALIVALTGSPWRSTNRVRTTRRRGARLGSGERYPLRLPPHWFQSLGPSAALLPGWQLGCSHQPSEFQHQRALTHWELQTATSRKCCFRLLRAPATTLSFALIAEPALMCDGLPLDARRFKSRVLASAGIRCSPPVRG